VTDPSFIVRKDELLTINDQRRHRELLLPSIVRQGYNYGTITRTGYIDYSTHFPQTRTDNRQNPLSISSPITPRMNRDRTTVRDENPRLAVTVADSDLKDLTRAQRAHPRLGRLNQIIRQLNLKTRCNQSHHRNHL
jgi:hypothetical protein